MQNLDLNIFKKMTSDQNAEDKWLPCGAYPIPSWYIYKTTAPKSQELMQKKGQKKKIVKDRRIKALLWENK